MSRTKKTVTVPEEKKLQTCPRCRAPVSLDERVAKQNKFFYRSPRVYRCFKCGFTCNPRCDRCGKEENLIKYDIDDQDLTLVCYNDFGGFRVRFV